MALDPFTIASIIAGIGGTALQSGAARKQAQAQNRARADAARRGRERQRVLQQQALETTRKAVEEERSLGEITEGKQEEALALIQSQDRQQQEGVLGGVQAAQRGQRAKSAAKVIGTGLGTGALQKRQTEALLPLSEILRNAQAERGVTEQEIIQAGLNARGGGGLLTLSQILKLAPLLAAGGSGLGSIFAPGALPTTTAPSLTSGFA